MGRFQSILVAFLVVSCVETTTSSRPPQGADRSPTTIPPWSTTSTTLFSQGGTSTTSTTLPGGIDPGIQYPAFGFTGGGQAYCGGTFDKSGPTQVTVFTTIAETKMTVRSENLKMTCGNIEKCEDAQLADELSGQDGGTTYNRLTNEQLTAHADSVGQFTHGPFAVFSNRIEFFSNDGSRTRVFTTDAPIPVFPNPGPSGRFEPLSKNRYWDVTVQGNWPGGGSRRMTVTMRRQSSSASEVTIKLRIDIAGDRHTDYEEFPMPKESIYVIDTNERLIRNFSTIEWHYGDTCKANDEIHMNYEICRRTIGSTVDNYKSCY